MYLNGEVDKVVLIYNHFINTLSIEPTMKQILPINDDFSKNENNNNHIYDYEGGINSILDTILPLYIENLVYGIILDSKASEHASRMTAMKNATDNAKDVITKLEIVYNRARQSAITLELTDIIGGANAANGGN
jgi:F-type H+-transporting ATPase subunit gamma